MTGATTKKVPQILSLCAFFLFLVLFSLSHFVNRYTTNGKKRKKTNGK